MKRFLLTMGCLALFTTAKAEYIESNITIQVKLSTALQVPPSGGFTLYNHSVTSFKTIDFINQVALHMQLDSYSPKARLIYRLVRTDTELKGYFFIREKDRADYQLEEGMFSVLPAPHLRLNTQAGVETGKRNSAGVGTVKYTIFADSLLKPSGSETFLKLTGQAIQTTRFIASKQYPGKILNSSVLSMTGVGSFDFDPGDPTIPNNYAYGTIKLSAPKITENP